VKVLEEEEEEGEGGAPGINKDELEEGIIALLRCFFSEIGVEGVLFDFFLRLVRAVTSSSILASFRPMLRKNFRARIGSDSKSLYTNFTSILFVFLSIRIIPHHSIDVS